MTDIETLLDRWRYTAGSGVRLDKPINTIRLVSGNAIRHLTKAFRVMLPVGTEMTKHPYEGYWTVKDGRTLRQFGAVPIVRMNGRWKAMPELTDTPFACWDGRLEELGYKAVPDKAVGYLPLADYDDYVLRHGAD